MLYLKLETKKLLLILDRRTRSRVFVLYSGSCARKGLSIKIDVVRADLPTITEINRKFYDEWDGGKKQSNQDLTRLSTKKRVVLTMRSVKLRYIWLMN